MADETHTDAKQAMQIAGLVATACVITNIAFYFLSGLYFEDRAAQFGIATSDHILAVRGAFAVFTGSIGLASIVAALAPRSIGHAIAGSAGGMSLFGAIGAFSRGMTPVLGAALVVVGILFPLLTWKSLARARGAWSVLIALCSVYGVVLLFGAPKVRGILGIGLWTALIIPGMLAVATVALAMVRSDYAEGVAPGSSEPPGRA
jgi:hypothetical protein